MNKIYLNTTETNNFLCFSYEKNKFYDAIRKKELGVDNFVSLSVISFGDFNIIMNNALFSKEHIEFWISYEK